MSYVKVTILPTPYNIEFKRVGRLIFDINYAEYCSKNDIYWLNSKEQYHREDGPAEIWRNGNQYWFRYDKFHRENGPAEIWRDEVLISWWLNGIEYYNEKEFNKEIRRRNELRKHSSVTNAL